MAAKHLFVASAIGIFEKLAEGPGNRPRARQRRAGPHLRISADAMLSLGLLGRGSRLKP